MNNLNGTNFGITLAGMLALIGVSAKADTFGSSENAFTIDFVTIGNPGNTDDPLASNDIYGLHFGGVAYTYRIGATEVPQDWITKATNLGLTNVTAGHWTGNKPAADISWLESAAFVNWLNTSTGHQPAYDLAWTGSQWTMNLWANEMSWDNDPGPALELNRFRHKDAYYFLPSEDEWYKAAYHKNDGATANYWKYATGSNSTPAPVSGGTAPGTAVFARPSSEGPAEVNNNGGLSPYGTRGQNGNVWEWQESATVPPNDNASENRVIRGGSAIYTQFDMVSTNRVQYGTTSSNYDQGFRVASVEAGNGIPEPTSALLLLSSGWMWLLKRRRRPVP